MKFVENTSVVLANFQMVDVDFFQLFFPKGDDYATIFKQISADREQISV
jgi:hypothetical protein